MAGSTEGDTDIQYLGLLVSALITLIAGLLIHSFIIGVNVTDWWNGRSVTPVDHIVTSLGMSRMGIQSTAALYVYVDKRFLKDLYSPIALLIMTVMYDFFAYANIWLSSLLSIVLCLKISNLHSRMFLYLRGLIVHRTGYLIVAAVLFSASNSLIFLPMVISHLSKGGTDKITVANLSMDCSCINYVYSDTIGFFFPMFFYYISSVIVFTSLYHHTVKMKKSSNLSINLETYYSVMRFVAFTFIYNTIYFIIYAFCIFYYHFYCGILDWLYIVFNFLPALNSSYLIYRTPKLRSQMTKILQNVTDLLFQRKDTEAREDIEVVAL